MNQWRAQFNLRIKLSFTCQGVVVNRQVENYQPPCSRNCAQSPEHKSLLLCTHAWGSQMIYLHDPHLPWPDVKIPILTVQDLSRFSTTLGSWTHQRTVFFFKDGIPDTVAMLSVWKLNRYQTLLIWVQICINFTEQFYSVDLVNTQAELAVVTHIWGVKVLFSLHTDWRERMSVQTIGQLGRTPVSLAGTTPPSGLTTTSQWWPPMLLEMLLQTP